MFGRFMAWHPTAALEPVLDESALRMHPASLESSVRPACGSPMPVTSDDRWAGVGDPVDGVPDRTWPSGWRHVRHGALDVHCAAVRSGASDHELAALEVGHCDRCDVFWCDDGGAVDRGARLLTHGRDQPAGGDVAIPVAV